MAEQRLLQANRLVTQLSQQLQRLEQQQSQSLSDYETQAGQLIERLIGFESRVDILLQLVQQIISAQQVSRSTARPQDDAAVYPLSQGQWIDRLTRLTQAGRDNQ